MHYVFKNLQRATFSGCLVICLASFGCGDADDSSDTTSNNSASANNSTSTTNNSPAPSNNTSPGTNNSPAPSNNTSPGTNNSPAPSNNASPGTNNNPAPSNNTSPDANNSTPQTNNDSPATNNDTPVSPDAGALGPYAHVVAKDATREELDFLCQTVITLYHEFYATTPAVTEGLCRVNAARDGYDDFDGDQATEWCELLTEECVEHRAQDHAPDHIDAETCFYTDSDIECDATFQQIVDCQHSRQEFYLETWGTYANRTCSEMVTSTTMEEIDASFNKIWNEDPPKCQTIPESCVYMSWF